MRDYAGLVNDLRCHAGTCEYKETECGRYNKRFDDTDYTTCSEELCDDAADTIEELLAKVESSENRHVVESEMIDEMYAENERLKNKVPKWISVKERLPETRSSILGQKSNKVIIAFRFDDGTQGTDTAHTLNGDWVFEDRIVVVNRTVTHWMPLPKPPKGVE